MCTMFTETKGTYAMMNVEHTLQFVYSTLITDFHTESDVIRSTIRHWMQERESNDIMMFPSLVSRCGIAVVDPYCKWHSTNATKSSIATLFISVVTSSKWFRRNQNLILLKWIVINVVHRSSDNFMIFECVFQYRFILHRAFAGQCVQSKTGLNQSNILVDYWSKHLRS